MPKEYLTNPCLRAYPFGCLCEADAAAFRRALQALFIQRWIIISEIQTVCKEIAEKVSQKSRRSAYRVGFMVNERHRRAIPRFGG